MGKERPESIEQIRASLSAGTRIAESLLLHISKEWDVDPMIFVHRKVITGSTWNLNGSYLEQLSREAERLLLRPARVLNGLKEHKRRLGMPYLHPQIEISVGDVEKWLVKYDCKPRTADSCRDFSLAFQGDAIRVICMTRDTCGPRSGFATYRKGEFSGYLEDTSTLNMHDFIPVLDFGKLLVSQYLVDKPRLSGTKGMLVILTLTKETPEPLLNHELGKLGYRVANKSEVLNAQFPNNFKGAIGLNDTSAYSFIDPWGRTNNTFGSDHDFEEGTLVYAMME